MIVKMAIEEAGGPAQRAVRKTARKPLVCTVGSTSLTTSRQTLTRFPPLFRKTSFSWDLRSTAWRPRKKKFEKEIDSFSSKKSCLAFRLEHNNLMKLNVERCFSMVTILLIVEKMNQRSSEKQYFFIINFSNFQKKRTKAGSFKKS